MCTNIYFKTYNKLKKKNFDNFIHTFLNETDKKVCLKINFKDFSIIDELKINPKENNDIVYNMKIACLFDNAVLSGNLDLVKYINDKYDAINRWEQLPDRYYTICFDPIYDATKNGFIEILQYLSSKQAIKKKYFENNIFTAKIIQISCLINFGYNKNQIINFLKTIYNLNDNTIITYEGSFGKTFSYNFEDIKNKLINEINLQIQINSKSE
jgi:hypothetical protein